MNIYLQYVIGLCAVASFAGIAVAQFRRGGRGESGEIIKFYKEESANYKDMLEKREASYKADIEKRDLRHAEELKKITTDFNAQMHTMTEKFGKLQGQYEAEKEMRERAEEILKDRNPETTKFMEDTVSILGQIKTFMEKINIHMEQDLKIEATITNQHPSAAIPV